MSIYRFKIQNEQLNEEMIDFACLHKYEDKIQLRDSFKLWLQQDNIKQLIESESTYLKRMDYNLKQTSLESKLFKSIKYYHIKKMISNIPKKEIKKETNRICFDKSFLILTHQYIQSNHNKKPAQLYDTFQIIHDNECNIQKKCLMEKGFHEDIILSKMKKMFKNKYFTMTQKTLDV